jgi:uncharacterized protein YjbJ (UPF0337 family)
MAKSEKTYAYICSGTARAQRMASALHNVSLDHVDFFERTRSEGERRMNRDEIKGKAEKAKGYIKEETGEAINDPDLEAEGRAERAAGKVREGFGKAKRKAGDVLDDAADKIDQ